MIGCLCDVLIGLNSLSGLLLQLTLTYWDSCCADTIIFGMVVVWDGCAVLVIIKLMNCY